MSRISCQTYKPHRYVYFCGTDAANRFEKRWRENVSEMKKKSRVSQKASQPVREYELKSDQRPIDTMNTPHTQNEKGENKPKSTNSNLIKLLNAF